MQHAIHVYTIILFRIKIYNFTKLTGRNILFHYKP